MNGLRRIKTLTYAMLVIAGIITLFVFPASSGGMVLSGYALLYFVVAVLSWRFFSDRHPTAMAWTRLLAATACLGHSVLMAAFYWAMAY